jgi:hypothetical protein
MDAKLVAQKTRKYLQTIGARSGYVAAKFGVASKAGDSRFAVALADDNLHIGN